MKIYKYYRKVDDGIEVDCGKYYRSQGLRKRALTD